MPVGYRMSSGNNAKLVAPGKRFVVVGSMNPTPVTSEACANWVIKR